MRRIFIDSTTNKTSAGRKKTFEKDRWRKNTQKNKAASGFALPLKQSPNLAPFEPSRKATKTTPHGDDRKPRTLAEQSTRCRRGSVVGDLPLPLPHNRLARPPYFHLSADIKARAVSLAYRFYGVKSSFRMGRILLSQGIR